MAERGERRRVDTAGKELVFAISADYERRTGGWTYARNVCEGLRRRGWDVRDLVLPAGFPDPDAAAREASSAAFAALPDGATVLVDQLCMSVLPEVAAREGGRLNIVTLVHHPLALELGRPEAERRRLAESEREGLRHAALALTTSATTAAVLAADYGVPPERLASAPPGIERKPPARGSADGGAPSLLCVGAVVPRKDHATLLEALAGLTDRPWRLTIVGNRTRAAAHAAALDALVTELGLADRIAFTDELEDAELVPLWRDADLYVSASAFEGFGIALAEAVAAGLPVVTTAAGAVPGWLDPRASTVVPVGDVAALRAAIGRVLDDPGRRRSMRDGALAARDALPTSEACVDAVEAALARL